MNRMPKRRQRPAVLLQRIQRRAISVAKRKKRHVVAQADYRHRATAVLCHRGVTAVVGNADENMTAHPSL